MFDFFYEAYRAFSRAGLPDPLQETLNLCDIISNGALRALDGRSIDNLTLESLDLATVIEQRQQGRPLEYILQRTVFMGRPFSCTPGALIPRAETELLVKTVIDWARGLEAHDPLLIVDVGTGSGNIAVSLALALPQAQVMALDISEEALVCAQRHVEQYKLQKQISILCGDLFEPLKQKKLENQVDIIVCNPPYIPSGSLSAMSSEIVDHEPLVALDAGAYGIDIFRRLVKEAPQYLSPGGLLAFEIGAGQDALVCRLLQKSGTYENIATIPDYHGTPRGFVATNKSPNHRPN